MPAPVNEFKSALLEGRFQLGLWVALASPYVTEVLSGSGYDWLLIDSEHGPNDLPLISAQLGAVAGSNSHPVVRPPTGEPWIVKQLLDAGAQTLLVPMVESVAQARDLVKAVRYPPHGIRGVGAALGRASNFSRRTDYMDNANAQVCLLLQIESVAGLAALDDIAALDGVDGVFIGPSDLAADMGFLGQPGAGPVQEKIADAFLRIRAQGKAIGIMTLDLDEARRYRSIGADFMAIGTDVTLLVAAADGLRHRFLAGEDAQMPDTRRGY